MTQSLTKLGKKTNFAVITKDESQKLCHSFVVAPNSVINQGDSVYLDAEGRLKPMKTQDDFTNQVPIGVSMMRSSDAPYPHGKVTVKLRGYALVKAEADGVVEAGSIVAAAAYDESSATNKELIYPQVKSAFTEPGTPNCVALIPSSAKGDIITIMYF